MSDGKPGFSIETGASVILRDFIRNHMRQFGTLIKVNRATNATVVGVYVDGLAGAAALTIAGGHGSQADVTDAVIKSLRLAIERDLSHMGRGS